ncbi:MAG: TOBE domain-containing protein [Desulfovibrio sp.]|nr:TOBE domain-containing protein [Desulfovibrio sp.]
MNTLPTEIEGLLAKLDRSQLAFLANRALELAGEAKPCPAKLFVTAEGVKHLSDTQLVSLTEAFRNWLTAARPANRLARQRMWFVYLMLRFTGARLGEVLTLDGAQDIRLPEGVVTFKGGGEGEGREVLLPPEVAAELHACISAQDSRSVARELFKLDQGYVRRKFQERARDAGLPPDLANPRTLRHTRAVELLREGVPLVVLQRLLGHSSADLTAGYLNFSPADEQRILNYHIQRELIMKTSARNLFIGKVTHIAENGLLAEVDVTTGGGLTVTALITERSLKKMGITEGGQVTALVKAPFVLVDTGEDAPAASASNCYRAEVSQVLCDGVVCEVDMTLADSSSAVSVITQSSAKKLALAKGDKVWCYFKAMSVILVD